MGAGGFPSVAGGGNGGACIDGHFFSFRFVNLWRKEQGKGGGKNESEGGGDFGKKKTSLNPLSPSSPSSYLPSRHSSFFILKTRYIWSFFW